MNRRIPRTTEAVSPSREIPMRLRGRQHIIRQYLREKLRFFLLSPLTIARDASEACFQLLHTLESKVASPKSHMQRRSSILAMEHLEGRRLLACSPTALGNSLGSYEVCWDGPMTGTASFHTASNWDTNTVPTSNDSVFLEGGTITYAQNTSTDDFAAFDVTLDLNGKTHNVDGIFYYLNPITVTDGTIVADRAQIRSLWGGDLTLNNDGHLEVTSASGWGMGANGFGVDNVIQGASSAIATSVSVGKSTATNSTSLEVLSGSTLTSTVGDIRVGSNAGITNTTIKGRLDVSNSTLVSAGDIDYDYHSIGSISSSSLKAQDNFYVDNDGQISISSSVIDAQSIIFEEFNYSGTILSPTVSGNGLFVGTITGAGLSGISVDNAPSGTFNNTSIDLDIGARTARVYSASTPTLGGNIELGGGTMSSVNGFAFAGNTNLAGTGDINGNATFSSGATVNPSAADLTFGNGIVLSSGAKLQAAINGSSTGTRDRINVSGAVSLSGAQLQLSGSPSVAPGDEIVVVSNDGSDAIVGVFSGLSEGHFWANFLGTGQAARLTYAGGTGNNDVVVVMNSAPTNIAIDDNSIEENTNTTNAVDIGMLSTVDVDAGETFTYTLVSGNGTNDADNGKFQISGSKLQIKPGQTVDFETQPDYKVFIQSQDSGGLTTTKAFTITVDDVNESADVSITGGVASVTDPDGDTASSINVTSDGTTLTFTETGSGLQLSTDQQSGALQVAPNAVSVPLANVSAVSFQLGELSDNVSVDDQIPVPIVAPNSGDLEEILVNASGGIVLNGDLLAALDAAAGSTVTVIGDSQVGDGSANSVVVEGDLEVQSGAELTLLDGGSSILGSKTTVSGTLIAAGGVTLSAPGGTPDLLEGNGTLQGSVSVNGGEIDPIGSLQVTGDVNFSSSSTLNIDITDQANYDQLLLDGASNLSGAMLGLGSIGSVSPGDVYKIIDKAGISPVVGAFDNLPEGETLTIGGLPAHITYVGGDGNDVAIVVDGAPDYDAIIAANGGNAGDDTFSLDLVDIGGGELHLQLSFDNGSGLMVVDSRPYDSISADKITINGGDGDDTFVINLAGGNLIPADGIFVNGQGNTSSPNGDTLQVLGGNTDTVTFDYVDNTSGGIMLDGALTGTITYTGLEPITSSINTTDVILNYSTATETITVSNASGDTNVNSTAGETTTFTNPTGTLTINAGLTGDDTININSLPANYPANVVINGEGPSGTDIVNVDGTLSLGVDKSLTVDADTINLPNATSDIIASGLGSVSLTAADTITMVDGALIDAGSGSIELLADGDITLGGLTTSDDVTVDSTSGSILEAGDIHREIVASSAFLSAGNAVGATGGGNWLDTQVTSLEGTGGNGGFFVWNLGNTEIGNVGTAAGASNTGVSTSGGPIELYALSGSLTISEDVDSNSGALELETGVAAPTSDIFINAPVRSGGSPVEVHADRNIVFGPAGWIDTESPLPVAVVDLVAAISNSAGGISSGGSFKDVSAGTLIMSAGSGGIGAVGNPLTFSSSSLSTDTSNENSDQFLSVDGSSQVTLLEAGIGTITLAKGELNVVGTVESDIVAAGLFDTSDEARLIGSGTINGNVSGDGFFSPNMQMSINGDFTPTGKVEFLVNRVFATPGSDYDQFVVDGLVNLSGAQLSFDQTIGGAVTELPVMTLLDNVSVSGTTASTNPVAGETITIGGSFYQLSYSAGSDSNDVELTQVGGISYDADNDELTVFGSNQRDAFRITERTAGVIEVRGSFGDVGSGSMLIDTGTQPVDKITALLYDGDDSADVRVDIPTLLLGGAGNDSLRMSGGVGILVGGPGSDSLRGNDQGVILIGGDDEDRLIGSSQPDILVGGNTANENDLSALELALDDLVLGNLNDALSDLGTLSDDFAIDDMIGRGGLDELLTGAGDRSIQ